jgi:hypothetical protein
MDRSFIKCGSLCGDSPCQQGAYFIKEPAGCPAFGHIVPILTFNAGAFGQIPDFEVELISFYCVFHCLFSPVHYFFNLTDRRREVNETAQWKRPERGRENFLVTFTKE